MTVARSRLVKKDVSGVYHCISRCVRGAFLCGKDLLRNRDYEHRKDWLRDRLIELSRVFYIDVCGYAIMENHLHVLLRNRPKLAKEADIKDVITRWWVLFPGRRDASNQPEEPTDTELEDLLGGPFREQEIRERLCSLSWFMRCLKENVARRANQEDGCTGHFWEGRFKSIALLDRAAILTCAAYVDLNPIRAGLAASPEASDFTSAQDRIVARQANKAMNHCQNKSLDFAQIREELKQRIKRDQWLCPLTSSASRKGFLNISTDRYLEILDWTGRRIRDGKKGHIPKHLAPILQRLDVDHEGWLRSCQQFGSLFFRVAGQVQTMKKAAVDFGQKWFKGLDAGRAAFL